LIAALSKNYAEIVHELIAGGADLNLKGNESDERTPLVVAAEFGFYPMAKILVGVGANVHVAGDSETPLAMAIENGHSNIAKLLMQASHGVKFKHHVDIVKLGSDLGIRRRGSHCVDGSGWARQHRPRNGLGESGANPDEAAAPGFKERDGAPSDAKNARAR
jgi:ankyrin repeat protein